MHEDARIRVPKTKFAHFCPGQTFIGVSKAMATNIQAALRRGYGLVPAVGRRRHWHFDLRTNHLHLQTRYGKASIE